MSPDRGSGYESGQCQSTIYHMVVRRQPIICQGEQLFRYFVYAQSAWVDNSNVITFEGFNELGDQKASYTKTMAPLAGGLYLIELIFHGIHVFKFSSSASPCWISSHE